jgi:hypothetical protein
MPVVPSFGSADFASEVMAGLDLPLLLDFVGPVLQVRHYTAENPLSSDDRLFSLLLSWHI